MVHSWDALRGRLAGPAPRLGLVCAALLVAELARLRRPALVLVQAALAGLLLLLLRRWLAAARPRQSPWPVLLLGLTLVPTWLWHERSIASDGLIYYSYLRSSVFDGDLDLSNDFAMMDLRSGPPVFPVGPALLWSPFVLVAHAWMQLGRLAGAAPPNGLEREYAAAVCFATVFYASVGLLLLVDTLRRWGSAPAAFWSAVLVWVGSPLRAFTSGQGSMPHGLEFFTVAVALRALLAFLDAPSRRRAAWLGAACGLAFLVRYQGALLLLMAGGPLLLRLSAREERRTHATLLAILAGAFLLVTLPQAAFWQAQFGQPVLVPQAATYGQRFLRPGRPHLLDVLISPRGGLLTYYPVALAGALGLLALVRRDRRYVAAVVPVLLATVWLNASVFDWRHVRRFCGAFPLLAPGLVPVLAPLLRSGPWLAAVLALLTWRYDVGVQVLQRTGPVPVRAALRELADDLAAGAYAGLEPLSPRAAARLLQAYSGEAPLEGQVTFVDLSRDGAWQRLPARARGLSAVDVEGGRLCRWVEGDEARWVLPLAWRGAVAVMVEARALATENPQTVELAWNGTSAGVQAMTTEWQRYRFDVPASALRAGSNVVALRFSQTARFRRVRGEGPRVERSAALALLELHRLR